MRYNCGSTTTRQGFLTLWALAFLAGMSVLMVLILTAQGIRQQTTRQLVREYEQATKQYQRQVAQRAEVAAISVVMPDQASQRLLE